MNFGVATFAESGGTPGVFLEVRPVIRFEELVLNFGVATFAESGGTPGVFLEVRPVICFENDA